MIYQDIREYEKLVNEKFQYAEKTDKDSDWSEWNSMWVELGHKIRQYGGHRTYNREKTLTILINEIDTIKNKNDVQLLSIGLVGKT